MAIGLIPNDYSQNAWSPTRFNALREIAPFSQSCDLLRVGRDIRGRTIRYASMHGDFEIKNGIYLVQQPHELDLHNDFDFQGLHYSIEDRTLLLRWRRSAGE